MSLGVGVWPRSLTWPWGQAACRQMVRGCFPYMTLLSCRTHYNHYNCVGHYILGKEVPITQGLRSLEPSRYVFICSVDIFGVVRVVCVFGSSTKGKQLQKFWLLRTLKNECFSSYKAKKLWLSYLLWAPCWGSQYEATPPFCLSTKCLKYLILQCQSILHCILPGSFLFAFLPP